MSNLIYIDGELFHAEDLSDEVLTHYGVPGMKWGKRSSNRPEGVSRKTNRVAKKDAKEFTQAKMFYGEGAGNRRKLIKAKVNQRSVDGSYKKAFDQHVKNTDMAKRADQARGQRKRKNISTSAAKNTRGVVNIMNGNRQSAGATAVMVAGGAAFAYRNGGDKYVAKAGKVVKDAYNNQATKKAIRDAIKNVGKK